jgi:hypothetical protein
MSISRYLWIALGLAATLGCSKVALAQGALGHEVAVGLTGVYDSGYDRGFHYGIGYELSWSVLRVSARLALGDTDPRSEQRYALGVGVAPWPGFRFDVGYHHRSYPDVGFGDNLITFIAELKWRGLELSFGAVMKFPILDRGSIHNPFIFDRALFEHFLTFRIGYLYELNCGVGFGLIIGTHSRFEQQNLDYPQFGLVFSYTHARVGHFRLEGGIGTAGFFNQGSTIDRGFLRLEYVRRMQQDRRQRRDRRRAGAAAGDVEARDDGD